MNTANIAVTSGTEYFSASVKLSAKSDDQAGKLQNHFFKLNGPTML